MPGPAVRPPGAGGRPSNAGELPPGAGERPSNAGELPPGAGERPSGPPGTDLVPLSAAARSGPATGLALPPGRQGLPGADPVFVLYAGRPGANPLRVLLDAHPELACPPETRLAAVYAQITGTWSQLEGLPPSERVSGPPAIPEAALAGIRHTMGRMMAPYLERRGKRRYCDGSLGAAQHADVLRMVFPGAKFLCLYQYPLDVIAAGIEAPPWGVHGFGSDSQADRSPRSAAYALARFWAANTALILEVEERFPGSSHRVRYEDLLADPAEVSERIFHFLGVPPVPGMSEAFAAERERSGPAGAPPGSPRASIPARWTGSSPFRSASSGRPWPRRSTPWPRNWVTRGSRPSWGPPPRRPAAWSPPGR